MFKKMLAIVALSSLGVTAYAVDASQVEKSIELKDGSTVYIFKDGKMDGRQIWSRNLYGIWPCDGNQGRQKNHHERKRNLRVHELLHKYHRG